MMQTKSAEKKPLPINIGLAYQGFVNEPVPSVIFDAIESGSAKRMFNRSLLVAAFVAGIALALLVGKFTAAPADTVFRHTPAHQLALSAHHTYATDLVYPVQVNADDITHLGEWLSYRVGKNLTIEFLDKLGFRLIGANIIPDGATISSMAVYENQQKQRVSLFTRYSGGAVELNLPSEAQSQGLNVLHWQNNGYNKALVSNLDVGQLEAIFSHLEQ